jgi:NMD protein affecting ribosome stability and mRNA decay
MSETGMSYDEDAFMKPPVPSRPPRAEMCESCHRQEATDIAHFGDGTSFKVCPSCRPFDPRSVRVVPNAPLDPN